VLAALVVAFCAGARATLRRLPLGTLLSLVLAVAVFGGFLRVVMPDASVSIPSATPDEVVSAPVAQSASAPATAPAAGSATPRTFRSLAEAGRWLGVPVWQAADLPAGVRLVEVLWTGDPPAATVPGSLPRGQLLARYAADDGSEVLTLVQGRWRLGTIGAPADYHGTAALPDGTEIVWTRGGPIENVSHPDLGWTGVELRVGSTEPTEWGWWLGSAVFSLDQMLGIAASVARWDAATADADTDMTFYLVGSVEEAELLRTLLTSGQGWMASLPATVQVVVVTSDADEAAVRASLADLDRIRQSEGLSGLRVVDSRSR
jgi:hypothetical protein